ncbi:MAG: ATP-binding cassette domain-containing protein, partial [Actinobacteria bacterium]|nr:ATP-binding cassette domain-containing protein [Actinomycetota bacterium]
IEANIATVPRLLGWDRAKIRARVTGLLELVGLDPDDYRRRYPAQLSGGQRQRVGVARALAADPPVLLMDEPFGAIDPVTRARLQDEFLRLQAEVRKTVVFVTHDVEEAIKLGTRIAVLEVGGVLQQYDTPAEVLARPANRMVADFVGADRALKRLKVTPIPLDGVTVPPKIEPSAPLEAARAVMAREATDWLAVVDGTGELKGEITDAEAEAEADDGNVTVADRARRVEAWVGVDDSLEAALAATLLTESGRVAVVDGDRFLGVLTPTTIHRALRNSVDADAPEPEPLNLS